MRILLSALECEKGDVAANLAAHQRVLAVAHAAGCGLVVFPEMSLTGSLDPVHADAPLVPLVHPAVVELAGATADFGVAALFGVAERHEEGAFITQVFAEKGRVAGVQRKRHLGEGEEAFAVSDEDAVFELGVTRFAIAICAESNVDRPFAYAAQVGAPLVCLSSAPGLYGRRTNEAEWRSGWEWWCSAGLGDAQRHARERGLWIAMATQAGSTVDEDFPGVAALVNPQGTVVAQLPDWRAGNLVVDVPL